MFWSNLWWHVFPVKITVVEIKRWTEIEHPSNYEVAIGVGVKKRAIHYETGTESEFKYMPHMDDLFRMERIGGVDLIMHTDADYEGRHAVGFVVTGARGLSSQTASDRMSQTTQPENYGEE